MSSSDSMHSLAYENNNHSNNKGKSRDAGLISTSVPSLYKYRRLFACLCVCIFNFWELGYEIWNKYGNGYGS